MPVVAAARTKAPLPDLTHREAPVVTRPQPGPAVRPPAPAPVVAAAKRQEWLELIDSLRVDVERLRAGREQAEPEPEPVVIAATPKERERRAPAVGPAAKKQTPPAQAPTRKPKKPKPVQDEWGFFDPEQCGFAALLAKLEEITDTEEPEF